MSLMLKHIYLDGRRCRGHAAATTREAALVAQALGVPVDPESAYSRSQHIGEGPLGFYLCSRAGEPVSPLYVIGGKDDRED